MAVLKPKISILDEPDSGLDIDAVQAVAKGNKSSNWKRSNSNCNYTLCTYFQILRQT